MVTEALVDDVFWDHPWEAGGEDCPKMRAPARRLPGRQIAVGHALLCLACPRPDGCAWGARFLEGLCPKGHSFRIRRARHLRSQEADVTSGHGFRLRLSFL